MNICLVIDDSKPFLTAIASCFKSNPAVITAVCASVEQAISAIEAHAPSAVFLDHSLTEGGSEGFEILDWIEANRPKIKVISITSRTDDVLSEYVRRHVPVIGKSDLAALRAWVEVASVP